MADDRKSRAEQNAHRIIDWLMENRTEFEHQGINESTLTAALGLADADATEAVDRLENREEVVRLPIASTTPPQFILKPGRGWHDITEKTLPKRANG
jgi:hypothetical protein